MAGSLYLGNTKVCPVAVVGTQPTLVTKQITENGTYNASSDNADGYSSVEVNVSGGTQEPFPVRTVQETLTRSGYALNSNSYTNLYYNYNALPFYFDASNISAIEASYSDGEVSYYVYPSFINAFYGSSIQYIDFSMLSHLPDKVSLVPGRSHPFNYIIGNTTGVHIYFRALTTQTNYVSNVFQMICKGATNATIHFPSNLESIISGLTGYPLFGGTNTTIAYDLPATS